MASEAQIRASAKYDKENVIRKSMKLNKNTDRDIIEFLKDKSFQTYVKELIRADMKKDETK